MSHVSWRLLSCWLTVFIPKNTLFSPNFCCRIHFTNQLFSFVFGLRLLPPSSFLVMSGVSHAYVIRDRWLEAFLFSPETYTQPVSHTPTHLKRDAKRGRNEDIVNWVVNETKICNVILRSKLPALFLLFSINFAAFYPDTALYSSHSFILTVIRR